MDEKQYLQEDFDPKSLKVAQLRGILNEYDVSYPSNAKKNELINLFNDHIKANSAKYLSEYEKSVKNLNDAGFIDATSTKRRSRRSASADPGSAASTDDRQANAMEISEQPSDISGVVSDNEENKESIKPKAKRKAKKSKKADNKENLEESKTADALKTNDSGKVKSEVKKEQDIVKDNIDAASDDAKNESTFSNDNVFQSPPNSADVKKIKSPTALKSPGLSKKRHRDNEEETTPVSKKSKSTPQKSPSVKSTKNASKKKGHLFDDNDSSDSDTDIFSKSIIHLVRTPKLSKVQKPTSRKSTPIQGGNVTPLKSSSKKKESVLQEKAESTPIQSRKLTPLKSSSKKKESILQEKAISTPSKKRDTPSSNKSSAKKNNTAPSEKSFVSFNEEKDDFDKHQRNIKSSPKVSAQSQLSSLSALTSADLASQLGINIQGLPPKDYQLNENSFGDVKNEVSNKKLTPRPRKFKKISQPELDKLNNKEDDDEIEDEDNDHFSKVEEEIKEEIEKLNKFVEGDIASPKRPSLFSVFSFIALWLIILAVGLSGYWYREQTYLVGYCGQEIHEPTIPPTSDLPDWLVQAGAYVDEKFKPKCAKCPAHARCYPYLELGCYEDFVEYKPWYFDLLPIINPSLKKCIPDTKKAEKLEIMIEVSLDLLRSKNANKNCGKTPADNFEAGLSVDELHDLLLLMKAPYITKEEFEELWQRSVIELEKEPEVITGLRIGDVFSTIDFNNTRKEEKEDKIFRSTSLSNLSLKCQMQNTIMKSIIENKSLIFACIGAIVALLLVKYKYQQFTLERVRVEIIYNEVLKKLRKQYKISQGSNGKVPSYIGSTQLRDLILTSETNLTRKLALWNKISHKIESNSNIRYRLIENHGEIMKVWEWITDMEIHD